MTRQRLHPSLLGVMFLAAGFAPYVADRQRLFGPGVTEAMNDTAHLRVTGFSCVDYGAAYDEIPREQPRRSLLDRLLRRDRCRA